MPQPGTASAMTPTLDYQPPQQNPGRSLRLTAILLIIFGGLTLPGIGLDALSRALSRMANTGGSMRITFGIHVGAVRNGAVLQRPERAAVDRHGRPVSAPDHRDPHCQGTACRQADQHPRQKPSSQIRER